MLAPHESDGPEDSGTVIANVKKNIVKKLPYIQSIAEKQGKKFIVSDSVSYLKAGPARSKAKKTCLIAPSIRQILLTLYGHPWV